MATEAMDLYDGILTTRAIRRFTDKVGQARRRPPEKVTHWNRFGDRRDR